MIGLKMVLHGFISAHRSWAPTQKTCLQSMAHCVARCHYIWLRSCLEPNIENKKLILAACALDHRQTRLRQIWTKVSLLQVFHGKNIEVLLAKVCFTKGKSQQKATRLFLISTLLSWKEVAKTFTVFHSCHSMCLKIYVFKSMESKYTLGRKHGLWTWVLFW